MIINGSLLHSWRSRLTVEFTPYAHSLHQLWVLSYQHALSLIHSKHLHILAIHQCSKPCSLLAKVSFLLVFPHCSNGEADHHWACHQGLWPISLCKVFRFAWLVFSMLCASSTYITDSTLRCCRISTSLSPTVVLTSSPLAGRSSRQIPWLKNHGLYQRFSFCKKNRYQAILLGLLWGLLT